MGSCRIFNIERFATEDGKGIRTVIFLKGCALRCIWCANPESQSFEMEIIVKNRACVSCGRCLNLCPEGAISLKENFGYITDSNKCGFCLKCIDNCYADARQLMGREYSVDELIPIIMRDREYYLISGGGVTFSGGEPFFHDEFITETSQRLKKEGISALVETCGFVPLERIQNGSRGIDYIFYDVKMIDPEKHKAYTGQDNALILSNLEWLCNNYQGELTVRYPYVPGCNDDIDDLRMFFEYMAKQKNIYEIVFLPYHRLGTPKYQGLGRSYKMGDMASVKKKELLYLKDLAKEYGLAVSIK